MKKLLTVVFTMLLAVSPGFAQAGGGSTDSSKTGKDTTGKKPGATSSLESKSKTKTKGGKKGHKGGKKSKKGSSTTTTPPPK